MRRPNLLNLSVGILAGSAMVLSLTPAVADPLPGVETYPKVAFLARNDVPFDAQTAASMAAQLGAPIFITNPNVLADAARDGIAELDPDVLIVAGGVFAVSDDVASAAAAACDPDCVIDRYAGAGRDDTAALLAGIAAKYGFTRPVLQGANQIVGDVHVGGNLHAESLRYGTPRVHHLNLHATAFQSFNNADYQIYTRGVSGQAGTTDLLAPLTIPDGASVIGITFVFYDTSANDVEATVNRQPLGSEAIETLGTATSSGTSGYQQVEASPISNAAIDNGSYGYMVHARPASGDSWEAATTTIKHVVIEYELAEAP